MVFSFFFLTRVFPPCSKGESFFLFLLGKDLLSFFLIGGEEEDPHFSLFLRKEEGAFPCFPPPEKVQKSKGETLCGFILEDEAPSPSCGDEKNVRRLSRVEMVLSLLWVGVEGSPPPPPPPSFLHSFSLQIFSRYTETLSSFFFSPFENPPLSPRRRIPTSGLSSSRSQPFFPPLN